MGVDRKWVMAIWVDRQESEQWMHGQVGAQKKLSRWMDIVGEQTDEWTGRWIDTRVGGQMSELMGWIGSQTGRW